MARQGKAILIVSSDLEEILVNSDTIVVLHAGRVALTCAYLQQTRGEPGEHSRGGNIRRLTDGEAEIQIGGGDPMIQSIDINIDCGESFGNWRMGIDDRIIPLITTANVACGFHAGDPLTMRRTVGLAQAAEIAVGSHPGLPDLLGFGRRPIAITPDEAYAYVLYQSGALRAIVEAKGMVLHHVKPHGALYGMLTKDHALATATVRAIVDVCPQPLLY